MRGSGYDQQGLPGDRALTSVVFFGNISGKATKLFLFGWHSALYFGVFWRDVLIVYGQTTCFEPVL